ncbi:MAG: ABC transporter C-terminal domain-containing protein, partial [Gemmataceae bacterium]
DEYLRLRASHAAQTGAAVTKPAAVAAAGSSGGLSGAELRAAQKELTAIERRLEKLSGQIDTAHQRLAEHDQGDYEGLQRLTGSLRELEGEVTELEDRWMELSEDVSS